MGNSTDSKDIPRISGNGSRSECDGHIVSGNFNTVIGNYNEVRGNNNSVYGHYNKVSGNFNSTYGTGNLMTGNFNARRKAKAGKTPDVKKLGKAPFNAPRGIPRSSYGRETRPSEIETDPNREDFPKEAPTLPVAVSVESSEKDFETPVVAVVDAIVVAGEVEPSAPDAEDGMGSAASQAVPSAPPLETGNE